MTRVCELMPGDKITLAGIGSAVYVTQMEHPHYSGLQMVVWAGVPPDGGFSFDALHPHQEVGEIGKSDALHIRAVRLRRALMGERIYE